MLGRIGLWTAYLDQLPWSQGRDVVQEVESLGYGALWFPEAVGRDGLVASTLALSASERLVAATGIASIYGRDALTMNCAWRTISEAYPDRFILGLGVSHGPMVEGLRGATYGPPLTAMRHYLDQMDSAPYFGVQPLQPRRVLAALGPRMLALAAERADGAHPYNVTPEHTQMAREVLGAGKLLAVEQKAVLTTDATKAREIARKALAIYMTLPNYVNNWKRLGFTELSSDAFLDAIVVWGDEATIKRRVDAHLDAGADHVCVQVLGDVLPAWRRLAPALL
ncbi:MAG TPA: LLM class F420-dependent oxidoreductase [Acidimicrobiia bacterium]|nr:LLM class F420-dependent oxidoreductase [Acidimicrobiia bacterium]